MHHIFHTKKCLTFLIFSVCSLSAFSSQSKPSPLPFPRIDAGKAMPEYLMPHLIPTREAFRKMKQIGLPALMTSFEKEKDPLIKAELADSIGLILAMSVDKLPEAVKYLEEARKLIDPHDQDRALDLTSKIGITYLQIAEVENCRHAMHGHSCVFPFTAQARHLKRSPTELAREHFIEYLKKKPDDIQVRWLLLVASMALNEKVPKNWELALPKQTTHFPRFLSYAHKAGIIDRSIQSGGAAIEDLNGDGCPDLIYSSNGVDQPMRFYAGDCKGRFVNKSKESGLAAQMNVINFTTTDFNNDGKLDLYLHRGGWFTKLDGDVKNSLLRNNGNNFTEVTSEMGLDTGWNANVASVWFDFNNDGKLDLFVCQERRAPELFVNTGEKFIEVAAKSGIVNDQICKGASVGDVNNDANLDLYLSNYTGLGRLFINNGDGTFREDKQEALQKGNKNFSFGTFFFDYDNDGWDDLFIATLDPFVEDTLIDLFQLKKKKKFDAHMRLFKNNKGVFRDVTKEAGLAITAQTMGLNFGDFDNDGHLDIYLGTGSTPYGSLSPNRAFRNVEGKRFEEITFSGGFGNLQKGHGISFGDINLDGHQDVLKNLGGHVEASEFVPELLMNPGNKNNWIRFQLKGTKSNVFGLGSQIKLEILDGGKKRNIFHRVGGTGSYGQNSLSPLIGIGKASKVLSAEFEWAGSKTKQLFKNLPMNNWIQVSEDAKEFKVLSRPNAWDPETKHHH